MTRKEIVNIVNALKPSEFEYKWDNGKKTFGFIAQDLLEIFPDDKYTLVKQDNDGHYFIDQTQLISLLCVCIQELLKKEEK